MGLNLSFVLFIYLLFISIRVYKANMFECRIKRYQGKQVTIFGAVVGRY